MRRTTCVVLLLAVVSGCVSSEGSMNPPGGGCGGHCGVAAPPSVPGLQGPWGQPVAATGPYAVPSGERAARAMMSQSLPLEFAQFTPRPGDNSGVVQAGLIQPAGLPMGPGGIPTPAGIIPAGGPACPPGGCPPGGCKIPGAVAAVGALTGGTPQRFPSKRTSVRFLSPAGMKVAWYAPNGDGKAGFATTQLEAPGRYNFIQAAIYRLKLSDIANRPGLELYPTLEVVPSNGKTDPFLAHSSVPITFTDEDFDQVAAGNFVVKVIYLPDPQFQDLATTGPDEVVSSRLEPGVDPIAEAHRRGSILLIVRIGNIDLEAPNTPAMDAPSPYQPKPMMPPQAMGPVGPGGPGGANVMMPYGMAGPQGNPMMGNPMMGQGSPMAPKGSRPLMIMGPNGPMLIGPNGPMIMNPNGPMPGNSAAGSNPPTLPGASLPPAAPAVPATPATPPGVPATKADCGASDVQPVQFQSPAALASQEPASTPAKKVEKRGSWFWSR